MFDAIENWIELFDTIIYIIIQSLETKWKDRNCIFKYTAANKQVRS